MTSGSEAASQAGEVVLTKLANAQISGNAGPFAIWAGGRVTLTTSTIAFAPNGMNRAFTGDAGTVVIPIGEIREVRFERGIVTNIVTVLGERAAMRVRCYGTRALADRIEQLRGQLAG